MAKKMEQESGDNSQNFQVAGNLIVGVSASEARQIAIDVFKANFYDFSEKAAKIALERAEEITDNFIEQFYSKIPHLEEKLQEPSVQSTMFNTQKEYAKTGDKELKDQLLDLLIKRIDSEERSLKQIVLDEAITIIPKLTQDQINVLTLIFSAVNYNHRDILNIPSFVNFINNKILRFFPETELSFSFFTHLQFTGCCTILPEGSSYKPFDEIIKNRLLALFSKGFTEEQLTAEFGEEKNKLRMMLMRCLQNPLLQQFNPLNEDVFKSKIQEHNLGQLGDKALNFSNRYSMNAGELQEYLKRINPRMERFLTSWKEKDFKTIRPTSVGFAIAVLNYNRVTGSNIPIESFI